MRQATNGNSPIADLGELPANWVTKKVGEIAQVRGGKRLPAGKTLQSERTGHPYVRVSDMHMGGVSLKDILYVPEDAYEAISDYRIYADDVFISVAGTLGIVGRIPPVLNGANLTENADRVTAIQCDVDYLKFWLSSDKIQNLISTIRTIGAQPKLALGRIKQFTIPLPPTRTEQRLISTALQDSSQLISSIEQLIQKKKSIKQGMMQELLSGRTRLAGFSGSWKTARFQDLASPVKERVTPSADCSSLEVVELENLAQGTGQLVGTNMLRNCASLKTRFREGDVLFGKLRAYLRKFWLADRDGFCSTEIWALRANPRNAVGAFVRYLVESEGFVEVASAAYGTHMPRSDWRLVGGYETQVPEADEQTAIAAVLADADAEIRVLQQRADKTREIKQGLLQELLTGRTRLVPREVQA